MHEGIESTLTILNPKLREGEGKIIITRDYELSLPRISVYGSELNQVWINLVGNSIDAAKEEGRKNQKSVYNIWVRTKLEANYIVVEIADDGPGIPQEIQSHMFELFFTTKNVGKGTGPGLSISYRIVVELHHGTINFESRPGDTRFYVRLPVSSSLDMPDKGR